MKQLFLFASFLLSFGILAQNPICDGSRFLNPDFQVDTTLGVVFGNSTSFGGTNADLQMDIFEPEADLASERPLIILAFGGSFISGAREDMHGFCNYYAERGYVCATIDYRIYDGAFFPFPDSVDMTDVVLKAVSDMKAAVRFFYEDAATTNTYRVDTTLIFAGGISAGGIVASHIGFFDETDPVQSYIVPLINANGGYSGNSSTNTQYGEDVAGVLNFSGALKDAAFIDPSDPPLFSVHDDGDDVVPYGGGNAAVFGIDIIYMQGSGIMHQQAQSNGVTSELLTVPNSVDHVSYFQTAIGTDTVLTKSLQFLYPIVCPQFAGINEGQLESYSIYPNPANDLMTIELGTVLKENAEKIILVDMTGRQILEHRIEVASSTIDVSALQEGTYQLLLMDVDNNLRLSELVVVK